jgi:flagellar hook-basal body complex protein FliE
MAGVGIMIGHACDQCGQSMASCDAWIKETGQGCCPECFTHDTHGLLDRFKVVDVAELAQEADNHSRLIAQMVIARSEHAKAIYQLRAQVDSLTESVAKLEAKQDRVDEGEKRHLLTEVMAEVRKAVHALPERVQELEDVAVALEGRLGLRRRPKSARPKALGSGDGVSQGPRPTV